MSSIPTARTIYLVDVENTLGCSPAALSFSDITAATARLRRLLDAGPADTVVVACNPAIGRAVERGWPGVLVRRRGGPNGADLELAAALRDDVLARYDLLVICSGDRALLPAARRARLAGLWVTNVSIRCQRHRRYASVAHRLVDVPPFVAPTRRRAA